MRRNFDQPILDLWGKEVKPQNPQTGEYLADKPSLTLTTVVLNAVLGSYEDERALTGKEKAERMQLALKINKNPKEVDLTAEQLAKIKELVGKAYGTLIVGRAYELLEMEPKAVESGSTAAS